MRLLLLSIDGRSWKQCARARVSLRHRKRQSRARVCESAGPDAGTPRVERGDEEGGDGSSDAAESEPGGAHGSARAGDFARIQHTVRSRGDDDSPRDSEGKSGDRLARRFRAVVLWISLLGGHRACDGDRAVAQLQPSLEEMRQLVPRAGQADPRLKSTRRPRRSRRDESVDLEGRGHRQI